jgi:hypothetical protein
MRIYHPDKYTQLRIERISLSKVRIFIEKKITVLEDDYYELWDFEITFSLLRRIINMLLKEKVKK